MTRRPTFEIPLCASSIFNEDLHLNVDDWWLKQFYFRSFINICNWVQEPISIHWRSYINELFVKQNKYSLFSNFFRCLSFSDVWIFLFRLEYICFRPEWSLYWASIIAPNPCVSRFAYQARKGSRKLCTYNSSHTMLIILCVLWAYEKNFKWKRWKKKIEPTIALLCKSVVAQFYDIKIRELRNKSNELIQSQVSWWKRINIVIFRKYIVEDMLSVDCISLC